MSRLRAHPPDAASGPTRAEPRGPVQPSVVRLVQQPRRPLRELEPLTPDDVRALLRAVGRYRRSWPGCWSAAGAWTESARSLGRTGLRTASSSQSRTARRALLDMAAGPRGDERRGVRRRRDAAPVGHRARRLRPTWRPREASGARSPTAPPRSGEVVSSAGSRAPTRACRGPRLAHHCVTRHKSDAIESFTDGDPRNRHVTGEWRRLPPDIARRTKRKLAHIDLATRLEEVRVPPGNRLPPLPR